MASDEVRYGVIGSGMMGIEHLLNLKAVEGARITAIADPEAASRDLARQLTGLDGLAEFGHHRDLLDAGVCDAVVVATPNMTHVDVMLDVLASGTHEIGSVV